MYLLRTVAVCSAACVIFRSELLGHRRQLLALHLRAARGAIAVRRTWTSSLASFPPPNCATIFKHAVDRS